MNEYGMMGYNPYPIYGRNMMPNSMTTQIQSLIRVTGIEGAKAYQMPANSIVPLFDDQNDIMYVKSTDGAGFPTIRTFAFTPIENQAPQPEYVTRAEFNELKEMIENGKQSVSKSKSTSKLPE
jgi:hypothetical protein